MTMGQSPGRLGFVVILAKAGLQAKDKRKNNRIVSLYNSVMAGSSPAMTKSRSQRLILLVAEQHLFSLGP
jgi:hypothetical protein